MDERITIEKSSGNVFADLGLPNPEERLAKAELAREIRKIITDRGLTQAQAGALLGIAQPNVSELVRGKLARFSIDKLMSFLVALGRDVDIVVSSAERTEEEPGEVTVTVRGRSGGARPLRSVPASGWSTEPTESMAASNRNTRQRARITPAHRGSFAYGI